MVGCRVCRRLLSRARNRRWFRVMMHGGFMLFQRLHLSGDRGAARSSMCRLHRFLRLLALGRIITFGRNCRSSSMKHILFQLPNPQSLQIGLMPAAIHLYTNFRQLLDKANIRSAPTMYCDNFVCTGNTATNRTKTPLSSANLLMNL